MTVREFLEQWSGDIWLMDNTGSIYCSFRQNVPLEFIDKQIKKIELERKDILITI